MISFNFDEADDRFDIVVAIIQQEIADRPSEVKAAVATYADGNLGAARFIAQRCKAFTTKAEVEQLVGWPLSGTRQESGSAIYVRFSQESR